MQTIMLILHTDGIQIRQAVNLSIEPTLLEISKLLRPLLHNPPLDHVAVLYLGQHRDMFVDERGHLRGLPRNKAATAIYRAAALARPNPPWAEAMPCIVGTAVIFPERRVWF